MIGNKHRKAEAYKTISIIKGFGELIKTN